MRHPMRLPMRDDEISRRFNAAFSRPHRTVLIGGGSEPVYLPAQGHRPAVIRYTRDYAQSALHELAHWCLAGPRRRTRLDYGYWYQPPPRSPAQQRRFERVETPVQGLELVMALATGVRFHVSADNHADPHANSAEFRLRIFESAARRLRGGLSPRTLAVLDALNPHWEDRLQTSMQACLAVGFDRSGGRGEFAELHSKIRV
jgi:elongation factor P hydroxylase